MIENDYDYFKKLPGLIVHPSWGVSFKTKVKDEINKKGVCYLNKEDLSSFRKDASSWKEIFYLLIDELSKYLTKV